MSSPEFLSETSIQIQLQETPVVAPPKVEKKKVIKKVEKKIVNKPIAKPVEELEEVAEETPQQAQPQKRAFKSFIDNFVRPHYPRLAKRRGITGNVELLITVQGNGILKDVQITQSSGHPMLDESALSAAKRWTFKQISSNPEEIFQLSKLVVYKFN